MGMVNRSITSSAGSAEEDTHTHQHEICRSKKKKKLSLRFLLLLIVATTVVLEVIFPSSSIFACEKGEREGGAFIDLSS